MPSSGRDSSRSQTSAACSNGRSRAPMPANSRTGDRLPSAPTRRCAATGLPSVGVISKPFSRRANPLARPSMIVRLSSVSARAAKWARSGALAKFQPKASRPVSLASNRVSGARSSRCVASMMRMRVRGGSVLFGANDQPGANQEVDRRSHQRRCAPVFGALGGKMNGGVAGFGTHDGGGRSGQSATDDGDIVFSHFGSVALALVCFGTAKPDPNHKLTRWRGGASSI